MEWCILLMLWSEKKKKKKKMVPLLEKKKIESTLFQGQDIHKQYKLVIDEAYRVRAFEVQTLFFAAWPPSSFTINIHLWWPRCEFPHLLKDTSNLFVTGAWEWMPYKNLCRNLVSSPRTIAWFSDSPRGSLAQTLSSRKKEFGRTRTRLSELWTA